MKTVVAASFAAVSFLTAAHSPASDTESKRIQVTVSVLYADIELGPDDGKLHARGAGEPSETASQATTLHLASEEDYREDEDRWYLKLGPMHSISGKDESPTVALATALASPRITLAEGSSASVSMGEKVHYFEKRGDGLFELKQMEDVVDGVTVGVQNPTINGDGSVSIGGLSLKVVEILGRKKVEGAPCGVGKPEWRSAEINFSPTIPRGKVAVVRMPSIVEEDGMLFLAIQVETPVS